MVTAQHIGRLGNNLFQISAAIGYARKFNYKWQVDPSSGLGEPYSSIHRVFPNLPKGDIYGRIYKEHPHAWCHVHNCHYDLCHFDYHEFIDRGGDVTLFGFYQSLRYFEDVQEEVKKVFKLDHYPEYNEYTSVHFRRGDYVQHSDSFPPVTVEYFNRARKLVGSKYLVFSDDIAWCKDNLKDVDFCEERDDRKSLSIMASCGNHIIANSSFSWWGAYLGHNPDKVVVSPSCKRGNWFGMNSGVKKDADDLIPKEWIQIEFR